MASDAPAAAALETRLKRLIAHGGPIPLADFMRAALLDPEAGYYARAEPFGARGDFVTAPEVSQLFGEIVGAFLVDLWRRAGAPANARLMELGPGRGTLMADVLRVAALAPDFLSGPAAGVDLVEASPRLAEEQRDRLAAEAGRIRWHAALPDPMPVPTFVIANEFFDALPIRQFERRAGAWRERRVGVGEDGAFVFVLGPPTPLPEAPDADVPEGAVIEVRPEADALMRTLAAHVVRHGGAVLAIDYGYAAPPLASTFQSVSGHRAVDPLAAPGTRDLTAHVDFAALARAARAEGAAAFGPVEQGDFLLSLGLLERAGRLGADKDERVRAEIRAAVERLAGPEAMGRLFKVLAVTAGDVAPAGFDRVGPSP